MPLSLAAPAQTPATYHVSLDGPGGQVRATNTRTGSTQASGATTDVVLSALFGLLGSTPATISLSPQTHTLGANLTVPATVSLTVPLGALLSHGVYSLAIDGPLVAGPYHLWSGSGTVSLGPGSVAAVYAEWWGVSGTGDEAAINAALLCAYAGGSPCCGTVQLLARTYHTAATIALQPGVTLAGAGSSVGGGAPATVIVCSSSSAPCLTLPPYGPVFVRDFDTSGGQNSIYYASTTVQTILVFAARLRLEGAVGCGVLVNAGCERWFWEHVSIAGCGSHGIWFQHDVANDNYLDKCHFRFLQVQTPGGCGIRIECRGTNNTFEHVNLTQCLQHGWYLDNTLNNLVILNANHESTGLSPNKTWCYTTGAMTRDSTQLQVASAANLAVGDTVTVLGAWGPGMEPLSAQAQAISGGSVTGVSVSAGGSGYTSPPTVSLSGGGGSGASATATLSGGALSGVTVTSGGSGYTSPPTVSLSGGGGSGAAAVASVNPTVTLSAAAGNSVSGVYVTNALYDEVHIAEAINTPSALTIINLTGGIIDSGPWANGVRFLVSGGVFNGALFNVQSGGKSPICDPYGNWTLLGASGPTGPRTVANSAPGVLGQSASADDDLWISALYGKNAQLRLIGDASTTYGSFVVSRTPQGDRDERMRATLFEVLGSGGVRVVAAPLQVSDVMQWQDSTGGVLAKVDNSGNVTAAGNLRLGGNIANIGYTNGGYLSFSAGGPVTVLNSIASAIPLAVKGGASQSADLQQWQDNAGHTQLAVANAGTGVSPIWALRIRAVANAESMGQAHTLGAYSGKSIQVLDDAGATVGWLPLYG